MNRILLLIALLYANVNLLIAGDEASLTLQNVATGMHQIRLPDGKSLFGDTTAVMGAGFFDLVRLDDDTTSAFRSSADLIAMLRYPIKVHGWTQVEYYPPKEIIRRFQEIVEQASHFNTSALQMLWHFLRDGNIHGVLLPGLKPQLDRAAFFQELFEWRSGIRPDARDALEAIRIERERLDAIAEEEAKRKAEADEEVARVAAIAAAENARVEAAKKTQDATSTLRHRKGHGTTSALGLDTDDRRAGEKDPLLPRPIRAH
jgi:hypothetical protein